MRVQIAGRTKKTVGILLLVLTVASLTAVAVSATKDNFDPSWGPNSQNAYNSAYSTFHTTGEKIGAADGTKDGDHDCQFGLDDAPDSSKYHRSTSATNAQALGKIDGFNDGLDEAYNTAYENAYQKCSASGKINQRIAAVPINGP
jgi:hypothetical protein